MAGQNVKSVHFKMICHENKIIFIHLPRSGGSVLEKQIAGKNQGKINIWHKHLDQEMSKKIYKDYWNEYRKITLVRNPFDWLVSYLHFDAVELKSPGPWNFKFFLDRVIDFNSLSAIPSYGWMTQPCRFFDTFNPEEMDCILTFEDSIVGKNVDPYNSLPNVKPIFIPDRKEGPETKRKRKFQSYYDDEMKFKVEEFFSRELKYFNYTFN
jgi:hypothetical protein